MTPLLDRIEVLTGRRHDDARGFLHVALGASQLPIDARFGELYLVQSVSAGDRRGDHLHRAMDEWFSVVIGAADLQLFDPGTDERAVLHLLADPPRTVRVPAGVAHCLVNVGPGALLVVAWATAEYDPADVHPCSTV